MVARGNIGRHQLARIARLVLPLGAVALLSTIFLLPQTIDPQRAVELAEIDVTEITREPRVGAARFAGVTQDDTAVTIRARTVRSSGELAQTGPIVLSLKEPEGTLRFPAGRIAQFQGNEGRIDQPAGLLRLQGGVRLETSDGYVLSMPELQSDLGQTHVEGQGGVSGIAPSGEISSDTVKLTRIDGRDEGYLLAFRGNVRLIYLPDE
ncbi:MAG: hypothetical protein ACXIUW_17610 [Roseinatronobacter sp.]